MSAVSMVSRRAVPGALREMFARRQQILGIINMAGAFVAMMLLDKTGRRPLMITGTTGNVLTLIGLAGSSMRAAPSSTPTLTSRSA
jgi:Sugar (and other) transporter